MSVYVSPKVMLVQCEEDIKVLEAQKKSKSGDRLVQLEKDIAALKCMRKDLQAQILMVSGKEPEKGGFKGFLKNAPKIKEVPRTIFFKKG